MVEITDTPARDTTVLYQQLGQLTRQLHDTLAQLGVMPRLQEAAQGLPDARSRLNYVAEKTADAAHRVLNAVDAAKAERQHLGEESAALCHRIQASGYAAVPAQDVLEFLQRLDVSTEQLDAQLTDIMLAQDFHDLTGQVVRKVLSVATALEDNLVQLLLQAAPGSLGDASESTAAADGAEAPTTETLQGPAVAGVGTAEVVTSQSEVDDLLASLGF